MGVMVRKVNEDIYFVKALRDRGYIRKRCKKCGRYFWTLKEDLEVCGDQPCVPYSFIGSPPVGRLGELEDIRSKFLKFFERRGHTVIRRYPVVARWREDVYLVGASIYDFQPWVTEGLVSPPANPLVISQPCIRLTDIEEVGVSGRHLTSFEMMAHHAFNFPERKVYWNEETVEYSFDFFVKELGIREEEINYIEDWWSGGGNAGEDFEITIRGLEVATLVFMHYRSYGEDLHEMKNRIVDTGYGLERIFWLTKGDPTIYDAIFGELIGKLRVGAGLKGLEERLLAEAFTLRARRELNLRALSKEYGYDEEELSRELRGYEAVYRLVDHSRSLMFMLGDGVVPSNTGEGYLARLLVRRSLRDLSYLNLRLSLSDIVEMQINYWADSFPEYKEVSGEILEMIKLEEEKYFKTIDRGKRLLKRRLKDLRARGGRKLPLDELILLYDSHGLPPEVVSEEARKEGLTVEVPDNFYALLAERHSSSPIKGTVTGLRDLEEIAKGLPPTIKLYYDDPSLAVCDAKVLRTVGKYVVLDRTIFYPEGGGQPADRGLIVCDKGKLSVINVKKIGEVVIHEVDKSWLKEGDMVKCLLDVNRRKRLMRAHTATHIILGAARKFLGKHVWQAGAQKGERLSRLDITHYKHLSEEEVNEIERIANEVVMEDRKVLVSIMDRNEAERKYGFTLYQGGVVPSRYIRVVEIEGWDAEACGGLHCPRTGCVGPIKIVKAERIQDGVERLEFVVGEEAIRYYQMINSTIRTIGNLLNVPFDKLIIKLRKILDENKILKKELMRFKEEKLKYDAEKLISKAIKIGKYHLIVGIQKNLTRGELIKLASHVTKLDPYGLAFLMEGGRETLEYVIMLGEELLKEGLSALDLLKELKTIPSIKGGGKEDLIMGILGLRDRNIAISYVERWLRKWSLTRG